MTESSIKIQPISQFDELEKMYHYVGSGLDNYWLSPELYEIGEYGGMETIVFPRLYDVQATIGMHICSLDRLLGPKEIRFLRIEMEFSELEMSSALGEKYEKAVIIAESRDKNIYRPLVFRSDLLLRYMYLAWLGSQNVIGDDFKDQALHLGKQLGKPVMVSEQRWQIVA